MKMYGNNIKMNDNDVLTSYELEKKVYGRCYF